MSRDRADSTHNFVNSCSEVDYEAVFKTYFLALRKYACIFVPVQIAEDIVQDILVHLWENRENLIIHTSLEAYLFRSVYHRCISSIKLQNLRSRHLTQIEIDLRHDEMRFFDSDENGAIRKLFMNDLNAELNQAINSLPSKCREVFEMSFLQDYRNKEISEKLKISVNTVESHITNALKALRKKLSRLMLVFI